MKNDAELSTNAKDRLRAKTAEFPWCIFTWRRFALALVLSTAGTGCLAGAAISIENFGPGAWPIVLILSGVSLFLAAAWLLFPRVVNTIVFGIIYIVASFLG